MLLIANVAITSRRPTLRGAAEAVSVPTNVSGSLATLFCSSLVLLVFRP